MPEQADQYLNRVTITIFDDFYAILKHAATEQNTSIEALIIEAVRDKLGLGASARLPIETLRKYLVQEMKLYAKDGFNSKGFLTQSEDNNVFAAVHVAIVRDDRFADAFLIAHIVRDSIVIERDENDKPLVDALLQVGVPRSQIILAYAGEPVPNKV